MPKSDIPIGFRQFGHLSKKDPPPNATTPPNNVITPKSGTFISSAKAAIP